MKKIAFGALCGLALLGVVSCGKNNNYEIDIVYTTDVHCGVDDNLGYATLKQYYSDIDNKNKILIDSGDSIQGSTLGSMSKGEYIIDIMNEVGYDCMTIGNHEFDYGVDQLKALEEKANFDFLSCNLEYTGKNENKLSNVKPYDIFKFGKKKVGIIGVSTPLSHTSSTPKNFMEDGEFVYNFSAETPQSFYDCVQDTIDECDDKGCDFIVLASHLGLTDDYSPYSVADLVSNISGIDCVLDGHAHYDIEGVVICDENDKTIPILDSGTKLNEFGHLNIKNGKISTKLVKKYDKKDTKIEECIQGYKKLIEDECKKVVCTSDLALSIKDSDGVRMVRNRELPISNLCADAMRIESDAQIGFVNGGGVRADLKSGDITLGNIIDVHPYGNECCVIEATGQNIKDYLEFTTKNTKSNYKKTNVSGDIVADGEFGSFPCVSGIKFSVDTSKTPNIEVDGDGLFLRVNGEYRVKDIQVLNGDVYEDLDLDKIYTVATTEYVAFSMGDGVTAFNNCKKIASGQLDYINLINYFLSLDGKIADKYSTTEGRINIL